MSDGEEDYDELPPITVNSSTRDSRSFEMPCASEVALQRTRAERCELEILRMRTEHRALPHSDSSGSEGEAALAAAVTDLRLRTARAPLAPPLAALLAAAAPHSAARAFLDEYAHAARDAGARGAHALAARLLRAAAPALAAAARAGAALHDADAAGAGAWLCLALAAHEGRRLGAPLARAAHLLLDDVASAEQARALAEPLLRALPEPRARLELVDALRSGGAGADALADALAAAARAQLLPAPAPADAARLWRRLAAPDRYAALQLAARAHAHSAAGAGGAGDGALLAALAVAPPPARDQHPDALKVLVAASKLQVLFRVNK